MKILVVGDWHSELHEIAVFQALEQLGHLPLRFAWNGYFKPGEGLRRLTMPFLKAQNKYMIGPVLDRLNLELIDQVAYEQPDVVFVYRGTHIYPETLRRIRQVSNHSVLVGYNNDDPFSQLYPKWKWRHFLAGVPEYDLILAFRLHNLDEFKAAGAKRVELLRHWFIPERNYPVDLSSDEKNQFGCDVVFIGHYEDDGRLGYLEEIVRQGWNLRLFGAGYEWDPIIRKSKELSAHIPVNLVLGADYNRALCGAKVALCFFSKLNRDTYTTRSFEIPATRTMMLSEYSDDLAVLFTEGKEAEFFRNKEELSDKLTHYIKNNEMRRTVAAAGYNRVVNDGHDIVSRMKKVLSWVEELHAIGGKV